MFKKLIILMIIMTGLFGCTRFDREYVAAEQKIMGLINKDQFMPRAYRNKYFDHMPAPKYDDKTMYEGIGKGETNDQSYEMGFQDGCQTFTSAMGTGFARVRGAKIDAEELTSNPWYLRGYQDASTYCTFSIDWETH